jgi:hypothetical protein
VATWHNLGESHRSHTGHGPAALPLSDACVRCLCSDHKGRWRCYIEFIS